MEVSHLVSPLNIVMADQSVLDNVSFLIKLNDGTKMELTYKETDLSTNKDQYGPFKEVSYSFGDQVGLVSARLRVKDYGNYHLFYVAFQIKNERVQSRHRYLSAEDSLVLRVGGLGQLQGLLAHYQHKDWWTRPYFSTRLATLPERTQTLLWKKEEKYYFLLPVTDQTFTTRLAGEENGFAIKLSPFAGGMEKGETLAFSLGQGVNPYELAEEVTSRTISHLGSPTRPRSEKRYPEVLDYLGWCSWDAFYHEVNETGLLEKLDELTHKHLPVKWVMIDDGWLDVEENRLKSFEADKGKFPNGLRPVSRQLKEDYGVNWVGVWHTIAGYWGGILPGSELAKTYQEALFQTNSHKLIPNPSDFKGFKFWNDWHAYLKQQGIDFIKVDSQSAINNFLMYHLPIGEAARGIHTGLEASAGLHFDQCMINCMGMASENIWNRPLSAVSRNSDDFVPGDEISFKEHALQNVYNSYYHGQFYWGDWDMFWTEHDEAVQNAVLRSVSGGPIYFSDQVGKTNPELIWPLVLSNGLILRADHPGLPTEDGLFTNPNEERVPLKVWNTVNETGVLAAFNIHLEGETVQGKISPKDLPSLKGETFLVYDHFNRKHFVMKREEERTLSLEKEGVALFNVVPLSEKIVPIGLLNKYLASSALESTYIRENHAVIRLKEGGRFGFYCEGQLDEIRVNGEPKLYSVQDEHLMIVDCQEIREVCVVEITMK